MHNYLFRDELSSGVLQSDVAATYSYNSGDDEEDDSALLITRPEENWDDNDMITSEGDEQTTNKAHSVIDNAKTKHKANLHVADQNNSEISPVNQSKNAKRRIKKLNQSKSYSTEQEGQLEESQKMDHSKNAAGDHNIDDGKTDQNMELEGQLEESQKMDHSKIAAGDHHIDDGKTDQNMELFKSPLPETGLPVSGKGDLKSYRNTAKARRGRKRAKTDEKSAEAKTPVGSAAKIGQLVTPTIAQNHDIMNNYTTPLMDEVLQQSTLDEASKAPKKRRQSAPNTTDLEKLRALTSGRRVTRSLLATQQSVAKASPAKLQSSQDIALNPTSRNNVNQNNDFDNASLAKPQPSQDLALNPTNRNNDNQNDGFDDACSMMDPSGDARSTVHRQRQEHLHTGTDSMKPDGASEIKEHKISSQNINLKLHHNTPEQAFNTAENKTASAEIDAGNGSPLLNIENLIPRLLDQKADESFMSMSDYSSSGSRSSDINSSPMMNESANSNPILEKALRNLRCTASESPSVSNRRITRSSPGLLSPALSGVSEVRFINH